MHQYQRCNQCRIHRFSRYLRERAYWWSLGGMVVFALLVGGVPHA